MRMAVLKLPSFSKPVSMLRNRELLLGGGAADSGVDWLGATFLVTERFVPLRHALRVTAV